MRTILLTRGASVFDPTDFASLALWDKSQPLQEGVSPLIWLRLPWLGRLAIKIVRYYVSEAEKT